MGVITALRELIKTGVDIPDDIEEKSTYVESTYISGLKKTTEGPIQEEHNNKTSKNSGGIKQKYEAPTIEIKEMTPEKLEEMRKKLEKNDERTLE